MEEKRRGRLTGIKRNFRRARMDVRSVYKLDICCRILQTSRSDILRKGTDRLYEELTVE